MKDQFLINGLGGKRVLSGTVSIRGSKNAILPIMASSILFEHPISAENVPHIEDVSRMLELLEDLGAKNSQDSVKRTLLLFGNEVKKSFLNVEIAKRLRASIILSGPLLSRFKKVSFPYPGGCVIGKRPIDLFLQGFKKMGAKVSEKDDQFSLVAPNGLSGAEIFFKVQSVTATETFLMAAILASGKTVLRNVALEPEVESLALFLKENGAHIEGIGTTTLTVIGGGLLTQKKPYITIPDRIEAGSFLILGAITSNDLTIAHCNPNHLLSLIETLSECGVKLETGEDFIRVRGVKKIPEGQIQIRTHEYPGFPTDLQAPLAVFLTQLETESVIFETIFEGRLGYMEDLKQMGAHITVWDSQRALIKGKTPLKNRELYGPDIRAGLAYIIAAIVAKGTSVINNVYYIDRGYERIEERLSSIGVNITRTVGPQSKNIK
ncbi:MAG: UDP-N-acetylglucosamine 1-carboxyvinyltransferase [Patescibacteria group bacterium]|nr:UDP-N-acetylglucosamine 1-carboxyvinyltransferase [bacterium]MDZ4240644.1 UDP-N-acetylglucosamine 1-carboxyvinyltransferase [Patescibacteria group bacterium]